MAVLLDRLSKLGTQTRVPSRTGIDKVQDSPLPTINETIQKPPNVSRQPLLDRVASLPASQTTSQAAQGQAQAGFQPGARVNVLDLSPQEQVQGIIDIQNGTPTGNHIIDNFVRSMTDKGMAPEQIREAFMARNPNPIYL